MIVRSQNSQSRTMFSLRFRRNHLWPLGTDRLLRPGRGAGFRRGVQFSKRLNFEGKFGKCTECEGVEILRHRTGFLYKSCQTVLRLKQIHVSFKRRQKKCTLAVLCHQQNVIRIKLGPGTYQLFLLPGM